jgi:hypothetical protein
LTWSHLVAGVERLAQAATRSTGSHAIAGTGRHLNFAEAKLGFDTVKHCLEAAMKQCPIEK